MLEPIDEEDAPKESGAADPSGSFPHIHIEEEDEEKKSGKSGEFELVDAPVKKKKKINFELPKLDKQVIEMLELD